MTIRSPAVAVTACLALASASLWIAHEPVYDAWAWLVWGRELAQLALDTSSGPSWKPLPVVVTAVLSLAGDAAPELWLVLVRAAWLVSLVLAAQLAYRLAGDLDRSVRLAGAAAAAVTLLLLSDSFTPWAFQAATGMSEPLLVALVLAAVAAALDGRTRVALALGALAALVRPEAWPLLAAFGLWRWRAEPGLRVWLAILAVGIPALWVVPDLLAGDGTSAGERAVRGGGAPLHEFLEVFGRAAVMPLVAAWPLAVLAFAWRDRAVPVLAAGAFAWILVVAVMAAAGFPGLPRFMAPALAIVAVLAGVGFARFIALGRGLALGGSFSGVRAASALVVLLTVTLVQLPGRAADLPGELGRSADIARSHDRLRDLTRSIGKDSLLRCGALATSDVLTRTALAWELRVPLRSVLSFGLVPTESGAFVVGARGAVRVRRYAWPGAQRLGARGEWRAYSIDCPAAAGSARRTGVSGALR